MLVSFGLGNPVGGSSVTTTRFAQSVTAVLNSTSITAKAVPSGVVSVFHPTEIRAVLDDEAIGRITSNAIMGVVE